MPDILIRNVPEDAVAVIDENASRLGLSRNEYLRQRLAQEVPHGAGKVTVEDFRRFAESFPDLADKELMRKAWE